MELKTNHKTITYPDSYIVWDLETTGFDFNNNHIVEIGLIVVHGGEITSEHKWILDNQCVLNPEAMAINGITQDIIDAEGRPAEECFREVIPFFNMNIPNLTHNGIRFDIPFLLAQCEKVLDWDEATTFMYKNKIEKNALDMAVFVKAGKLGLARDWNETFYDFGKRVMNIMAKGVKYNVGLCCDELGIDRSDVTLHRAGGDCNLTHQIYQKLIVQE